jgi:predicted transcriptional regulator
MVRLPTTLFLLLLLLPSDSSATLVVVIPTKDGLIVAADSRVTYKFGSKIGGHCDDFFKITELKNKERTVISVGNMAGILDPPVTAVDFCRYRKSTASLLDLTKTVKDYLDKKEQNIDQPTIEKLAERCKSLVEKFASNRSQRLELKYYVGKFLATVLIGHYDARRNKSVRAVFKININQQLAPELSKVQVDENAWHIAGVAPPPKFLAEFIQFMENTPVEKITSKEAMTLAVNLIEATSKINAEVGGPVDVVLLGKDPRPVRLQWKKP